jgi:uncharacterized protein (TIGR02996 family)
MEEALLQAIHDNPGDDLARQALADWLEEQGDPRGELLRLHLNLRQRPDGAERSGWEERLRALLAAGRRPCVPILNNSIGMQLVLIPPGKFLMGSPEDEAERYPDEGPQHEVEISQPFYLGMLPITQEQYLKVMGSNPSSFSTTGGSRYKVKGLDTSLFPVELVSWHDADAFCQKLSELPEEQVAHRSYRLPTESQWEHACRAGTTAPFHFGDSLSAEQANFNFSLGRTCAVGSYSPNAFGLHDMHGNVLEWCADWYDEHDYASSPRKDPKGPATGIHRVLRGGSWNDDAINCRAAHRNFDDPGFRYVSFGFRVVCSLPR